MLRWMTIYICMKKNHLHFQTNTFKKKMNVLNKTAHKHAWQIIYIQCFVGVCLWFECFVGVIVESERSSIWAYIVGVCVWFVTKHMLSTKRKPIYVTNYIHSPKKEPHKKKHLLNQTAYIYGSVLQCVCCSVLQCVCCSVTSSQQNSLRIWLTHCIRTQKQV